LYFENEILKNILKKEILEFEKFRILISASEDLAYLYRLIGGMFRLIGGMFRVRNFFSKDIF